MISRNPNEGGVGLLKSFKRLGQLLCLTSLTLMLIPTVSYAKEIPIYSVPTDEKVVALTFDISWGEHVALPVLDALALKFVDKATFFLSGPWSDKHPEVVQEIARRGYEIASHGWHHYNYSQYSDDWIREQVTKTEQTLEQIIGHKPSRLIRTPNGDYNTRVVRTLRNMGYEVIQWDTDSLDWKKPGVEQVAARVLERVHPGDIILMHASDSCPDTPEALLTILEALQMEGYRFVTVSELLKYQK